MLSLELQVHSEAMLQDHVECQDQTQCSSLSCVLLEKHAWVCCSEASTGAMLNGEAVLRDAVDQGSKGALYGKSG